MDFSSLHRKINVEERERAERCPREAGWFPARSVDPSLALEELRSRGRVTASERFKVRMARLVRIPAKFVALFT